MPRYELLLTITRATAIVTLEAPDEDEAQAKLQREGVSTMDIDDVYDWEVDEIQELDD